MADAEQEHWLSLAAKNSWPKGELRIRIRDAARTKAAPHTGNVLRLSLKVDASRERSWREAAGRTGLSLEDWIAHALDTTASS
jgi:hypothetical protein